MNKKRKLQVSNGHYLGFDQISQLIRAVVAADPERKMTMAFLEEETGLPVRQVRNRLSVARAMGLFAERNLHLTSFGKLIAEHDPFFEKRGSLEYIHYLAAGNYKNLIWFEAFNTLLVSEDPLDYQGWISYFRGGLAGQYSKQSLQDHLPKEVRFVIEAYTENSLKELELLSKDEKQRLHRRRYLNPIPLIFTAILYHYAETLKTDLMQVEDLLHVPGSPPMLFFTGKELLDETVELLHDKGYLHYEGTHDLNQVRLKEDFKADVFLKAYYEGHEPDHRSGYGN